MVHPHSHQAAQIGAALLVSLVRDVHSENAGVNDSHAGIEDGSGRVKVTPKHYGVVDSHRVVRRVGPHKADAMSIKNPKANNSLTTHSQALKASLLL
jgi:hypothetical protein